MEGLQKVRFQYGKESYEGHIVPPKCGRLFYIIPINWENHNFPHLVPPEDITLLEDENAKV